MTDSIQSTLSTQINLNTGNIISKQASGSIQYVDQSTGKTINLDAASTMLNQNPVVYAGTVGSDSYNQALAVFGDADVPESMSQTLASIAAYYSSQTGVSVQDLFKNGVFENTFLTAINNLRDASSQIAQFSLNTQPNWANNILLNGAVVAANSPRGSS